VDAARGHDPRLDVVFAEQKLDRYALSYAQLQETGGRLKATSEDSGSAPPPPPAPPADEREEAEQAILAADRAFAARASQVSAAQAFREFMDAEEGLLFRPNGEPLQGAEAIFQHQGGNAPETGKLTWEPVEAWASESGDFGASWGRSKFTPLDPSRPAQAYRYMTVWRKDRDGRWKGLMDMGSPAADLLAVPAAPGGQPRPAVPQPQGVRPPSP
jgi:ketosteroid isomerase-like protein